MSRNTIIFDLDGTLVDSSNLIMNSFNYALEPFDIIITPEQVEGMRSKGSRELFLDVLTENDAKLALSRLWEHSRSSAADTILIPGVQSILSHLADKQLTLGLWTARDRVSATSILEAHKIQHYFKGMVGGCEVKNNKPHPDGLILLADRLSVQPNTLIHIGDHLHDLQGAQSAGAISVIVKWCQGHIHVNNSEDLTKADFTFHSIEDFKLAIEMMLAK